MASTCHFRTALPVTSELPTLRNHGANSVCIQNAQRVTFPAFPEMRLQHKVMSTCSPIRGPQCGQLTSTPTRWLRPSGNLQSGSVVPRGLQRCGNSKTALRARASQVPPENTSCLSSWAGFRVQQRSRLGFFSTVDRECRTAVRCNAAPKKRKGSGMDDSFDPAKNMPPEVAWGDQELTSADLLERSIQEMRRKQAAENEKFRPALQRAGDALQRDQEEEDEEEEDEEEDEDEEDVVQDEYLGMVTRAPATKKTPGVQQSAAPSPTRNLRRRAEYEDEDEDEDDDVADDDLVGRRANGKRTSMEATTAINRPGGASGLPLAKEIAKDEEDEDFEEADWEGLDDEDLDLAGPPIALDDVVDNDEFEEEFRALQQAKLREGEEEADGEEPAYRLTLGELLEEAGLDPIAVEGDLDVLITGITQDSRQVAPGDLFVCCTGLNTDGHMYAAEAVEKGATVVMASREVDVDESVKALVMVEDTNAALAALADAFYGRPSQELLVVGITGTNGKTTTSWLVRSMYEAMGLRTGLLGTIMYSIGKKEMDAPHTTPDAVEVQKLMATMVHKKCEACVMEVSSHALALGRVSHVDFDVALFTNLTRDHMDFHQSEEEYREAKLKLFDRMQAPDHQRKVVNIDDPSAQYFLNRGHPQVPIVTYALENDQADVFPLEVSLSLFETELVVRTPKGSIELSSGLLGRHNVSNILAAIAVGIAVEAPLEDIVKGIEEVDAVPGRCELIDEEQAFAVLVDYAHTPDALARLLDTVRECGPSRIITVVGCGGDRDKGKRPMMCKIATDKSEVTILTSDNPRSEDELEILDDMLAGVGWSMEDYLKDSAKGYIPPLPNGHRLFVYDSRGVALRTAVAMGEEGDALVIAGKGHETYQIIGAERHYFDDREECREALANVDEIRSYFDTSEIPWRLLDKDKEQRPKRGAAAGS